MPAEYKSKMNGGAMGSVSGNLKREDNAIAGDVTMTPNVGSALK